MAVSLIRGASSRNLGNLTDAAGRRLLRNMDVAFDDEVDVRTERAPWSCIDCSVSSARSSRRCMFVTSPNSTLPASDSKRSAGMPSFLEESAGVRMYPATGIPAHGYHHPAPVPGLARITRSRRPRRGTSPRAPLVGWAPVRGRPKPGRGMVTPRYILGAIPIPGRGEYQGGPGAGRATSRDERHPSGSLAPGG